MENNEKMIIASEVTENTEVHETDELEFISSEGDVKDYPTPEQEEIKVIEATVLEESRKIIEDEPEEEAESDHEDEAEYTPKYLIKLVLVLTAICTCIALLLALVNSITKDRIAENVAKQRENAIFAIFSNGDSTEEYTTADGETVYVVYRAGEPIGYCVNASGTGFGGEVQVMVGLKADGAVYGIKIVSMSETPGIGTKVQGDSFLNQFKGDTEKSDADIISGATFSSKAVIEAVDYALGVDFDMSEADNR